MLPELTLPWIESLLLLMLIAPAILWFIRDPKTARRFAIVCNVLMLLMAFGVWIDFQRLHVFAAHDRWDISLQLGWTELLVVDELNAPLIPLCTLLCLLTIVATPSTKSNRFPLDLALLSQFFTIAVLVCRLPWGMIGLAILHTILPWIEMRRRGKNARAYLVHMAIFSVFVTIGWALVQGGSLSAASGLGFFLLIVGVLVRNGCVPLHCWLADFYEKMAFGTAILFTTPMLAAILAVRLVLPIASPWALHLVVFASLFTAIYSAAMALVQDSPRRFFAAILLSHMSMVFVGLEVDTAIGLTGALCGWLSVAISLTGFGLTIRAVEARIGRVSLQQFHGLYSHIPLLAMFFLLTGLASIGFPGTIGFVGTELMIEGGVELHPWIGMLVVLATALNGIAILMGYFRLFTGTVHHATASLVARRNERIAVWTLSLLILVGGVFPQPGVESRFHAATELLDQVVHAQTDQDVNVRRSHGQTFENKLLLLRDDHEQ